MGPVERGDPGEVDFVLGVVQPSDDEELPQPPERNWAALRRHRRPLSAVAGLALIGAVLLGVRSPTGGSTHDEAAAPSPPSSGFTVSDTVPAAQGGPDHSQLNSSLLSGAGYTVACPVDTACQITLAPAKPLAAAFRAAFPGAYLGAGTNSTTGPLHSLYARTVRGMDGVREITVQIVTGTGVRKAGHVGTGTHRRSYVQRPVGKYLVQVTVIGRASAGDPLAPLRRLAADPRLLLTD